MGDRAMRLENANQGDIAQMRQIAAEAMQAGAFGFSTSRTTSHKTPARRLHADPAGAGGGTDRHRDGVRDAGAGMLEMVSEWTQPTVSDEFAMFAPGGGEVRAGRRCSP